MDELCVVQDFEENCNQKETDHEGLGKQQCQRMCQDNLYRHPTETDHAQNPPESATDSLESSSYYALEEQHGD